MMASRAFNIYGLLPLLLLAFSCNSGKPENEKRLGLSDEEKILIEKLRKEVNLNPDSLGIRYQLMNAYTQGEQYKEALLQNDTLLFNDSTNAAVWFRRGEICLQTSDTANGLIALKRAITGAPAFAEPQLLLASVYAAQSNDESVRIADSIIGTSQDIRTVSRARFIKGLYYSNLNETDKALAQFDECLKSDYTFLDAYIEKGLLLYDNQKYGEALSVFERSIQVSNTFAEGYYHAGRCEEAIGNLEEAKSYYSKALALDKSMTAASGALEKMEKGR